MSVIPALWTTTAVSDWLAQTTTARILHCFPQACNLVNQRGEVLAVTAPALGRGPFTLVVALPDGRFPGWLSPETAMILRENTLFFLPVTRNPFPDFRAHGLPLTDYGLRPQDALGIDTETAVSWPPRPRWEKLNRRGVGEALPVLQRALARRAVNGPGAMWKRPAEQLVQGLAAGDVAQCRAAVRHLAGLGLGLTPAGDDFLLGVLLGLWAAGPGEQDREWGEMLVETAVPRTTTLSAAWLRAAARGESGEHWHELVKALVQGSETAVRAAAAKILGIGETSGAAALAGFTVVGQMLAKGHLAA